MAKSYGTIVKGFTKLMTSLDKLVEAKDIEVDKKTLEIKEVQENLEAIYIEKNLADNARGKLKEIFG